MGRTIVEKVAKVWESQSKCCHECPYYKHLHATMWEPEEEYCQVIEQARNFERCPGLTDDTEEEVEDGSE
jgi:hypothetical protein